MKKGCSTAQHFGITSWFFQTPLANHISSNEFPFCVHTTGFKQHRNFEVVGDLLA